MTAIEARKKGVRACMEKIGYDFCIQNQSGACVTYGENTPGIMFCFVGIDDTNRTAESNVLTLSSVKGFPYSASCNVDMNSGEVQFLSDEIE